MSAAEIELDPVVPEGTAPTHPEAAEPIAQSAPVEGAESEPPASPAVEASVEAAVASPAESATEATEPTEATEATEATAELVAVAPARVPLEVERQPPQIFPVPDERKRALLHELLERGLLEQVVVFTRTKHRANRVAEWLAKRGIVADRIHSQRSHRQRKEALLAFRDGKCRVLVAAARAGRMLEVETACAVAHFDMPETVQEWKERLGEKATALPVTLETFFVSEPDEPRMAEIEADLGAKVDRILFDDFDYSVTVQAAPVVEERREERPAEPAGERRARPKSRRSKSRRRGGSAAGADRPAAAGGNGMAAAESGDEYDDSDEARIRAIAEAQQAAAVAARFNPSRMGMMELRSGPAGGGRSARKRPHRGGGGGGGRGPF